MVRTRAARVWDRTSTPLRLRIRATFARPVRRSRATTTTGARTILAIRHRAASLRTTRPRAATAMRVRSSMFAQVVRAMAQTRSSVRCRINATWRVRATRQRGCATIPRRLTARRATTAMVAPRRTFVRAVHAMARTRSFVLSWMHVTSQARAIRRRVNATTRTLRTARRAAITMLARRPIRARRALVPAMPTRVRRRPAKRRRRATATAVAWLSTSRTVRFARTMAIPARRMFVTESAPAHTRRCPMERTAAAVRSVRVARAARNASSAANSMRRERSIRQTLASNVCRVRRRRCGRRGQTARHATMVMPVRKRIRAKRERALGQTR